MSATLTVVIVETIVLAVVVLFVVALLRSHAELLRRLGALESRRAEATGSPPPTPAAGPVVRDLVGETLSGDAVKLALGTGPPHTLLAFLSSGCGPCEPLWSALREGAPVPVKTRLVVVTKGPERESVTRLAELAPAKHELVMSTAAWDDFSVPGTPHFVLVDGGSGKIAGRGAGMTWEQIVTFVDQANGDSSRRAPPANSSSARAARAEEALAAAQIAAGHPSLYPSHDGQGGGERS